MQTDRSELFARAPVPSAVAKLVLPTIVSQLITVVYNMADTFFIGQTGDADQVAAAALCMPFFILLTGLANLFGIGGASLMSRSLGTGNREKASRAASFSIWFAAAVSLIYGLVLIVFRNSVLPVAGANAGTIGFCGSYLFYTVALGAVPTVLSACLAHLVRADGFARQAGFGLAMGGILNIILDPLFILVLNMEIAGAAAATLISNIVACTYFLVLILRHKNETVIRFSAKYISVREKIPQEVLLTGLPSSLMNLMGVTSNIVMNRLMASCCNEAVAGIGIAKKIDMLAFAIATGMSQGALPMIAYNFASGDRKRMRYALRTVFAYSLVTAVAGAVLLFTCAGPIVKAFIDDGLTVEYGRRFQRIICIGGPCISVTMLVITLFQATGKKVKPLILSMLRKGGLDIPFMLAFNAIDGVNGVVWATPIADAGAMAISLCMLFPYLRRLKSEETELQ